jgi:carbamoyltransferase
MIKWGVTAGSHDGSIAVFESDNLLFASDAERFSKKKNDSDISQIEKYLLQYCWPHKTYFYENPYLKATRRWSIGQKPYLKLPSLYQKPVYTSHHYSHACYGFFTSPFEECIVLSLDAIGEWDTMSVWHCKGTKVKRINRWRYPKSLGLMYSALTQASGWKPNEEEYIMMGAAAKSNVVNGSQYNEIKKKWRDGFNWHRGVKLSLKNQHDFEDIPTSSQAVYEDIFVELLSEIAELKVNNGNIVFVGGCALNVSANRFLPQYFDNVYIPPNPGDGGSAIGCVLARTKKHIDPNPYMGYNIPGKYPTNAIIATLLKNKVVGVANGPAEFGPRALGNRSFLADPRHKDIKDVVNEHKGRESFRPFAPMIRKERVDEFFTGGFYSEYMSCAWKANDYFRKAYPGVVHLDGTSRLQVVTREPHYTLLKKWEVETGCPVILNTSLNVKGQPIVNDCEDCKIFEQKTGVPVLTKEI